MGGFKNPRNFRNSDAYFLTIQIKSRGRSPCSGRVFLDSFRQALRMQNLNLNKIAEGPLSVPKVSLEIADALQVSLQLRVVPRWGRWDFTLSVRDHF